MAITQKTPVLRRIASAALVNGQAVKWNGSYVTPATVTEVFAGVALHDADSGSYAEVQLRGSNEIVDIKVGTVGIAEGALAYVTGSTGYFIGTGTTASAIAVVSGSAGDLIQAKLL